MLQTCNLFKTKTGVIIILNTNIDWLLKPAKEAVSFAKANLRKIVSVTFCVIAVFAVLSAAVLGGVRLAYNIKYNNKVITTVSDKQVYFAAVDLVADIVEGKNVKEVLPEPEISMVVVLDNAIESCDKVADAIIDNTEEIVSASKLIVDGVTLACADTDALLSALDARKAEYDNLEGTDCDSEFCADVKVEEGYFVLSEISEISEIEHYILALDVRTTAKLTAEEDIAYNTVFEEDENELIGYKQVKRSGEVGKKHTVTGVVYINGVKTDETENYSEVVKEPVDEIVALGSKKPKVSSLKLNSGFRFPLPSGVWEVSCPYGKSGHMGVDLRAPQGTVIMAAAGGTVTEAKYKGSYGNCVIIDHTSRITWT